MTYDADGIRFAHVVDGHVTMYLQDALGANEQVLQETTEGTTTSYFMGLGRLGEEDGGGFAYWHADALGSTRVRTDGSGSATGATSYDAWGGVRTSSGDESRFGFTGEEKDASGLIYLRARYYDPELGRFPQEDPLSGRATDTQGLTPYVYCRNNPVMLVDPSGQEVVITITTLTLLAYEVATLLQSWNVQNTTAFLGRAKSWWEYQQENRQPPIPKQKNPCRPGDQDANRDVGTGQDGLPPLKTDLDLRDRQAEKVGGASAETDQYYR